MNAQMPTHDRMAAHRDRKSSLQTIIKIHLHYRPAPKPKRTCASLNHKGEPCRKVVTTSDRCAHHQEKP